MHAETTGFARVACGVKPLHEGRSAQAAVLLHDAQNHAADNEGCRLTKAHAAAAGCQHILLQSCPASCTAAAGIICSCADMRCRLLTAFPASQLTCKAPALTLLLLVPAQCATICSAACTSAVMPPTAAARSWMPLRMLAACCSSSSAAAMTLRFSSSTSAAQRLQQQQQQQLNVKL